MTGRGPPPDSSQGTAQKANQSGPLTFSMRGLLMEIVNTGHLVGPGSPSSKLQSALSVSS